MKKKLLSVALCSLLTLGLASCDLFKPNSSSSEPSSSEVSSSEKSEVSSEEKSEVSSSEKEESSEPVSSEPESSEPVSSEPESSEPESSEPESSEPESSLPESSEPESSDPIVPETVTLYFENNWLWTDVCAYVYNSTLEENNYEVEWPGTKLEVVDTLTDNNSPRDRYVVTIDVSQGYDTVIFNGVKNDGSGNRDQSPNIDLSTVEEGTAFYMTWNDGNDVGNFPYTPEVDGGDVEIPDTPNPDVPSSSETTSSEPVSSEPESSEPESSLPESSEPESSEPESSL